MRQRPDEQDQHGHLVHRPGGGWGFHYDDETNLSDEVGYHFADERFIVGEYVSINERGKMHTYRVTLGVIHLSASAMPSLVSPNGMANERCEAASNGNG